MAAGINKVFSWAKQNPAIVIAFGLFFLSFIWKLFFIVQRDICIDEPFTIFHAQKSLWDIWLLSSQNEPNPPLFLILEHFVIQLFGLSPMAVRFPSLIFTSLTPVFIFLVGRKLFSSVAGITAALLFVFSTQQFYYGLEARTYALLYMAAAASIFFFFCFMAEPRNRKYFWLLILANIVMVYSHYFGWFVIFSEALIVLLRWKNKILVRRWILNTVVQIILYAPMWVVMAQQLLISGKGTWIDPPLPRDYYIEMAKMLNGMVAFNLILCILIATTLYYLYVNHNLRVFNWNHLYLVLLFFVPYTIMFFVSFRMPIFLNRYILFGSVSLYLLVGGIFGALAQNLGRLKYVPLFLLLIVSFVSLKILPTTVYFRDVQQAVAKVKSLQSDECLVVIHAFPGREGFAYYYNRALFSQPYVFDSLLRINNILPVWGVNEFKENVSKFSFKRIVYYQDGSLFYDPSNTIYKYLDSAYHKTDSVFFEQCFYVTAFDVCPTPAK